MSKTTVKIPREKAFQVSEELRQKFEGLYQEWILAGSYRRGKEMVGDLDIAVMPKDPVTFGERLAEVAGRAKNGNPQRNFWFQECLININISLAYEGWGAMLCKTTGPYEENILLRAKAKKMGLALNEHGLFQRLGEGKTGPVLGARIAGETEESVYRALRSKYRAPNERRNSFEYERVA